MTEDTLIKKWEVPLVPNNPNGETDPEKIDWGSDKLRNLNINWDRIEFLVVSHRDGKDFLHKHPKVPRINGFGGILAYQMNFIRFMREKVENGNDLIELADNNALLDIAATLANGGELPLN